VLASKGGLTNGTSCDLRDDVPEEINKLDASAFDYEDDSDLEDDYEDLDEPLGERKGKDVPSTHFPSIP
jgi:hypothetical protein